MDIFEAEENENPINCLSFLHLTDPASSLIHAGSFMTFRLLTPNKSFFFQTPSLLLKLSCSERVILTGWMYISLQHSSLSIPSERLRQMELLWQHAPIFLHDATSIRNGAQIASSEPELQENGSIMVWIPCRQRRGGFQCSAGKQALISMQHAYKHMIAHTRLFTAARGTECA